MVVVVVDDDDRDLGILLGDQLDRVLDRHRVRRDLVAERASTSCRRRARSFSSAIRTRKLVSVIVVEVTPSSLHSICLRPLKLVAANSPETPAPMAPRTGKAMETSEHRPGNGTGAAYPPASNDRAARAREDPPPARALSPPRRPGSARGARPALPAARRQLARRYQRGGEPLDDLIQVASLGLLKAIDRFEPSRHTAFSSFAVPTILGELKRHFRDRGWSVRVPRDLQELSVRVDRVAEDMSRDLGRAPTPAEIAANIKVSTEQVLEAREAAGAAARSRSTARATTTTRATA